MANDRQVVGSGGTKDGRTWANLVRQVEMENGKKRNKWAHSAKPTFFKCSVFTSILLEMAQKLHETPNLHWLQCAKQFWPIAPSSKISKFW